MVGNEYYSYNECYFIYIAFASFLFTINLCVNSNLQFLLMNKNIYPYYF